MTELEKRFDDQLTAITNEVKGYNDTLKELKEKLDSVDSDESKTLIEELTTKAEEQTALIDTLSKGLDEMQVKFKDQNLKKENWISKMYKDLQSESYKSAFGDPDKRKSASFDMVITGHPYSLLKVGTMLIDPNLGGLDLDTAVIVPMREPGVGKKPDRPTNLIDIWDQGTTGSNQITWVERTARTDGAASVAEGNTFGQSDYTYNLKKTGVEKIATYVKVSNESLDDWEMLASEIRTEIFGQLDRKLEEQTWSGTGTSPQLDGITNNAVAYTYTGLNAKISSPNTFDVIKAMATQVNTEDYFNATHVPINPGDAAEMMMTKDDNNGYLALSAMATGLVGGLQLVESNLVTAGNIMVCEARRAKVFYRKNITIEMWNQDQDDAIKDLKTITGKVRAAFRVKTTDYEAFCYDAIQDVKDLITKP